MGHELPPALFLMGPTASGKTGLALELASRLPFDIISVDSAQVYRGMDIGTAKPELAILAEFPHRLIDICDPAETYSAARFREDALREMASIVQAGRIPLLVGGTMMYYRALQDGLASMPAADPVLREEILAEAARIGWPAIHQRLARLDPEWASGIHPNHSQRIQRAWEVYRLTGETMTALRSRQSKQALPYNIVQFSIDFQDRNTLHERIASRFRDMVACGFIDEVECLYRRGDLHLGLPSIRSAGYRQAWEYLGGNLTREAMIEHAIIATRQLAKRQLTWLRGWPALEMIPTDGTQPAGKLAEQVINRLETAGI